VVILIEIDVMKLEFTNNIFEIFAKRGLIVKFSNVRIRDNQAIYLI